MNLKKITKSQAQKLFNHGLNIYLNPSKMRTEHAFGSAFMVDKYADGDNFDKIVNSYSYYNCNEETGKRVSYYCSDYLYERFFSERKKNYYWDEMVYPLKDTVYNRNETLLLSLGDGSNLFPEDEEEGFIGYVNYYLVKGTINSINKANELVDEGKEIDGGMVMYREEDLPDGCNLYHEIFVSDLLKNVLADVFITMPA